MDDNLDSPNSDDDSDSSSNSDSDDVLFGSDLIAAAAATGTGSKSLPIIARSNQLIPVAQTIDSDDWQRYSFADSDKRKPAWTPPRTRTRTREGTRTRFR